MSTFRFTKARKLAILRRMRELLGRRGGWIKNRFYNGRGGYCLLGAEGQALRDLYEQTPKADLIGQRLSLLDAVGARGFRYVHDFNDSPKTRKEDVLALIDEKIAELEA